MIDVFRYVVLISERDAVTYNTTRDANLKYYYTTVVIEL